METIVLPEDLTKKEFWICPRCKEPTKGYPATSRRDNKTYICSKCGSDEAIWDLQVSQNEQNNTPIHSSIIEEEKEWLEAEEE